MKDVGVTLVFGDLRKQNKKLKITNSSYKYANPGVTMPIVLATAGIAIARLLSADVGHIGLDVIVQALREQDD